VDEVDESQNVLFGSVSESTSQFDFISALEVLERKNSRASQWRRLSTPQPLTDFHLLLDKVNPHRPRKSPALKEVYEMAVPTT